MSTHPLPNTGRIREPNVYAAPSLAFDLAGEIRLLQSEQPWQAGHTAKTIVKYPDLRVVLVALKSGARMIQHETTGRISIHALSGCVRVCLAERTLELPAGSLVALDRDIPHAVEAAVDSAFLLTIAWPTVNQPAAAAEPMLGAGRVGAALDSPPSRLETPVRPRVVAIDEARNPRESGLDKTLADTFPCSDPLSSLPDPVLR